MIIDSEVALRIAMQADSEDEHLEFKEAKNTYEFQKLVDYCAALSNEGGGHIILGVTNDKPRQIVGTLSFQNIVDVKKKLLTRLRRRVDVHEITTAAGRVLAFRASPVPLGHPIDVDGKFFMRNGEELVAMTGDRLREVMLQGQGDLSATTVPGEIDNLLDPSFVRRFLVLSADRCRRRGDVAALEQAAWIESATVSDVLERFNLTIDGLATWAALLIMGSERTLGRVLPQAESIFEYRSSEGSIDYQERKAYRIGFLGYMDAIWSDINKRNEIQSFENGLLRHQITTFAERSVREAMLNAICHRSYFDQASVIIRQFPRRLEVISPGGFPLGVTPQTILDVSRPRNRLLHESMERCGLVERSGQGADLMFKEAINAAKPVPSFYGSDEYKVALTLNGQVRDSSLLAVLQKTQARLQSDIELPDLRLIDFVFHNEQPPTDLQHRVGRLVELGIIEVAGRGKLVLARNLYAAIGRKGAYTRRKGLAHEAKKALLLQHITENHAEGSPMRDLVEALPALDRFSINDLLDELRKEGKVYVLGRRRVGKWFAGPSPIEEKELPLNYTPS